MIRITNDIYPFDGAGNWSRNTPYCFIFDGGCISSITIRVRCTPFNSHYRSYWFGHSVSRNWNRNI